MHSVCIIQSDAINFQPFLPSFDIFHAFNDLFWAKWPGNWKALQMNSEKVETWHGIIISPTYHVQKSREGYGKNWMHFVYKLDNLFRSIRVSDENSSVTRALQCLLNSRLFVRSVRTIQNTSSIFNPFLLHSLFFMPLLIFWAKWPWNWKAVQMNSEKVESWHGIIISPT